MIQAVMIKPGMIEFREVPKPRPKDDEILIGVKRIGICGSDIHVFHGFHPYTKYPVVQGHEVSGIVAEVGQNVNTLRMGDRVTFAPQVTCGHCYSCTHGSYHICDSLDVMGFTINGAAQEYFAVAADMAFKLPAQISLEQAAMIEPVSVAVHALSRNHDVFGKKVLILGAGTIGNLVGQVTKSLGAEIVMITDINDFKLEKAKSCGLDIQINTDREVLEHAIAQHFGPDRADLILECVGSEVTINQAIHNARKGSTIVVIGVFGKKPTADIGLLQDHELSLVGSLMYKNSDYEKAIELVSRGKINLNNLISAKFPFKDYLEAYKTIDAARGNVLKVMIEL
jgi:L-iditol 2-dehydrogenase